MTWIPLSPTKIGHRTFMIRGLPFHGAPARLRPLQDLQGFPRSHRQPFAAGLPRQMLHPTLSISNRNHGTLFSGTGVPHTPHSIFPGSCENVSSGMPSLRQDRALMFRVTEDTPLGFHMPHRDLAACIRSRQSAAVRRKHDVMDVVIQWKRPDRSQSNSRPGPY